VRRTARFGRFRTIQSATLVIVPSSSTMYIVDKSNRPRACRTSASAASRARNRQQARCG
jgi:hypothetical protein